MELWQPNARDEPEEKPWITLLRRALLPRFQQELASLEQPHSDADLRAISRLLFSLAREVRFTLGPPKDAPEDIVDKIIDLFHRTGDALFVQGTHLEKTVYHATTLHERADIIQRNRMQE
ncbi:MAG: hypothetical protein PHX87_06605 [Candidatus Peribacteraceae bacterium]|nr:hypothetical protein [Candidatus Peribacteraceae bacterium]MDD5743060.1 hypothetical protein [Candidatus Peribacteraceae bacterium]